MNKSLSWKTLLSITLVCYVLKYLIEGEAIKAALEIIALISLISGVVSLITSKLSKKNKENMDENKK